MPKDRADRVIMLCIIGLVAWGIVFLPFLYGPPPRLAESGHPPKTHSEQTQQNSAAKPDGSEAAPFFIRIPKTAEEAAQEAEDRHEKATTDRWLMIFTGAVAVFTLLLVGATVLLYKAGEKQRASSERIATHQRESSEKIAKRSADLAERSLVLTDRPWIKIDIEIKGPLRFGPEQIEMRLKGTAKNIGRSPATYVHFRFDIYPDILAAARKTRDSAVQIRDLPGAFTGQGHVLFPGAEISFEQDCSITVSVFKEAIADMNKVETTETLPTWTRSALGVAGFAWYCLPGAGRTGRYRCTTLLLETYCGAEPDGFDGSETVISQDNLELVPTMFSGETT